MKIKIILALAMAILCCGCCSTPKVESTKPWEGHYMTVDDFKQSTNVIDLDKNESIWVLSNSTLKRLLKNVGK